MLFKDPSALIHWQLSTGTVNESAIRRTYDSFMVQAIISQCTKILIGANAQCSGLFNVVRWHTTPHPWCVPGDAMAHLPLWHGIAIFTSYTPWCKW